MKITGNVGPDGITPHFLAAGRGLRVGCGLARPKNIIARRKRSFIMAYKITDACLSCGTCAGACPVGAISEGDGKFVIDENVCVDCGTCAGACPADAIEPA